MTAPLRGSHGFFLHAHLPFVHHPDHADFLEEDWLFEAVAECYVPIVRGLERLASDGVAAPLTMSVSPPLCEMLANATLRRKLERFLEARVELGRREERRLRGREPWERTARLHADLFADALAVACGPGGGLLARLRALRDAGRLELVTCSATHGFAPVLGRDEAVEAQIAVAVANFEKHFGSAPDGIWLAECGWIDGIDEVLLRNGIRYTFVDGHAILGAEPPPRRGTRAPVRTRAGLAVLGRDDESSRQVWSSKEGYPGDFSYREFYRDLGYDGAYADIRRTLHSDGVRRNIGFKYHRITGDVALGAKEPYEPLAAAARADEHAANFLFNRGKQAEHFAGLDGREPFILSPYDAELFGHWWFEGPLFLECFYRRAANVPGGSVVPETPRSFLDRCGELETAEPEPSSWGEKGYSFVWLNGANDHVHRHVHHLEDEMVAAANARPRARGLARRTLNQMARECLLAESSDWPFIMTMKTAVPYAEKRLRDHVARFLDLAATLRAGAPDERLVAECERLDPIFPEIDYRVFASPGANSDSDEDGEEETGPATSEASSTS